MTIGSKRNFLLDKSTSRYSVFMDTDDFYNPDYISTSIYNLINSGKAIAGSADMNMLSNNSYYRLNCIFINMLNEATIVIDTDRIKFRFDEVQTSEGSKSLEKYIKYIYETNIDDIMVCVQHDSNTVSKLHVVDDRYKITARSGYAEHLKILSNII
jgi:hypothetical protein